VFLSVFEAKFGVLRCFRGKNEDFEGILVFLRCFMGKIGFLMCING
jgi:hypothetical protein